MNKYLFCFAVFIRILLPLKTERIIFLLCLHACFVIHILNRLNIMYIVAIIDDDVWRSGNHRTNQLLNSERQCKLLRGVSPTYLKWLLALLINVSVSVFMGLHQTVQAFSLFAFFFFLFFDLAKKIKKK